jgi:Hpt domain
VTFSSESLGSIFLAKLSSERFHLAALSAALARADDSPGGIFDDLCSSAHRPNGTASVFEAADIAAAADALEQAAAAAALTHSDIADPAVWGALLVLISVLRPAEVAH